MTTTTTPKNSDEQKHSSAVYAAAGIGDLAVEQLKKIPALAEQLRTKAEKLREQGPSLRAQATGKAAELTGKVDVEKIRAVLVTNAQKAAEKATHLYEELVARGERVVDTDTPAPAAEAKAVAVKSEPKPAVQADIAQAAPIAVPDEAAPVPPAPKATVRKPKGTTQK